jgi:hypothetical protein
MNRTVERRPDHFGRNGKLLRRRPRAPLQLRKAWILPDAREAKSRA